MTVKLYYTNYTCTPRSESYIAKKLLTNGKKKKKQPKNYKPQNIGVRIIY